MKTRLSNNKKIRNLIINGGLDFWQRGISFSPMTHNTYGADRFSNVSIGTGAFSIDRDTDVPSDSLSQYSMLVSPTTAEGSLANTSLYYFRQVIEGINIREVIGKKIALGFYVKSNKIGVNTVTFHNSGSSRVYVSEYTIDQVNTWEKKYISLDFVNTGTWNLDNTAGLTVLFNLASGSNFHTTPDEWGTTQKTTTSSSVNFMDNISNEIRFSDIMLNEDTEGVEKFQRAGRHYIEELRLCQRYFEKTYDVDTPLGTVTYSGALMDRQPTGYTTQKWDWNFNAEKRDVPTMTVWNPITGLPGTWYRPGNTDFGPDTIYQGTRSLGYTTTGAWVGSIYAHWTAEAEI
jgi:hypothetical protein